jgi:acetyl-CoA carboxylase/biotin carboxylase 1
MEQSRVAAALKAGAASTASKCGAQLRKAGVAQWEVKLRVGNHKGGDGDVASNGTERSPRRWRGAWRVVVSVPTGHEAGDDCVEVYREACDEEKGLIIYSANADGGTAMLSDIPTSAPYPPLEWLQYKRLIARRHNTTYCRDFPAVFENALRQMWAARAAGGEPGAVPPAGRLVELAELVPETATLSFRNPPKLTLHRGEENRKTVGVVAWVMTLRTPEYPQGRQIVAVANDITHASGAFGPAEDAMFRAATEYSLRERLPLVYLAANSGARVGLANEVKSCLRAAWTSSDDPSRGFDYLYLTPQDYEKLCAKANEDLPVRATKVIVRGDGGQMEERWRLTDVIGLEDGLGVECLSGSGAIAGVYARAFREGFTITLVSGRTVGIGAYLARLGRRCVQRLDQPIILTGYAALNKLLGREVYTSHMQLGGPKVMGANGVSHFVVEDDLAGVAAVLRWLSYTAARPGDPPPRLLTADPEDRPVLLDDLVSSSKLDPRVAIAGNDRFPGLFDRGSWTESQAGWARTVVTGRARLGGQAVGVVAVEVSTVMLHLPADPGLPDSSERSVPQAGQVWFPDSALKTAQAMEEFDLEGLPLFVLANWRGFSGGQRDLFEGVLQAGSLIVESLRTYRQPVIVYIPPGCELRGGAWVVIDSQINSAGLVESYADPGARGGVLEPEGVVEIKFRMPELRATMHRLDPVLREAIENAPPGTDVKNTPEFRAREAALLPVYHQIALAFAEMHDTPVRMVSKGVLRGIVPWERARAFFSHRLRSLLAREALLRHIAAADPAIKREEGLAKVHEWFEDSKKLTSVNEVREEHEAFLEWMESSTGTARLAMELKSLRHQAACRTVLQLAATAEGTDGLVKGLAEAVKDNPSLVLQLRSLVGTAMKEV